jgi:aryl-alcohol dehydrogenase-like predicted oxidoreductase
VRSWFPRFTPQARQANQPIVDLLRQVAQRVRATPAQIALAWLLAQRPWIAPIPGTRKHERLAENLAAASIELSVNDMRQLDQATAALRVEGARGTGREHYA